MMDKAETCPLKVLGQMLFKTWLKKGQNMPILTRFGLHSSSIPFDDEYPLIQLLHKAREESYLGFRGLK